VKAAVRDVFRGVVEMEEDEDLLDYIAGVVAEDAGEGEAMFEDTVGTLVQGAAPGLADEDMTALCERLRGSLDAVLLAASSSASIQTQHTPAEGGVGVRQLARGPVCMGDIDEEYKEETRGSLLKVG
jgi:hypothetical protein